MKSGEQQSIGMARLCFSSAAFTFFRNVSSPSKKARVKFKPVDAKRRRQLDPFENSHGVMDAQFVHEALGECG